jgi:hypothetical protein
MLCVRSLIEHRALVTFNCFKELFATHDAIGSTQIVPTMAISTGHRRPTAFVLADNLIVAAPPA